MILLHEVGRPIHDGVGKSRIGHGGRHELLVREALAGARGCSCAWRHGLLHSLMDQLWPVHVTQHSEPLVFLIYELLCIILVPVAYSVGQTHFKVSVAMFKQRLHYVKRLDTLTSVSALLTRAVLGLLLAFAAGLEVFPIRSCLVQGAQTFSK